VEEHVLARYKSPEGAASYNTKYERHWHKRLTTWKEYRVIRKCLGIAGPQDRLLDLPCGCGRLFPALQPQARRPLGMDVSLEMLKHARRNLARWTPPLAAASALHIPLPDKAVDLVFSARLFHHIPDRGERHRYIRELCRISRKWVVMTFFHTWSFKNILRMLRRPFNRKKPKVTMTTGELREVARSAGFEVVKTIPLFQLGSGHHYAILRRC